MIKYKVIIKAYKACRDLTLVGIQTFPCTPLPFDLFTPDTLMFFQFLKLSFHCMDFSCALPSTLPPPTVCRTGFSFLGLLKESFLEYPSLSRSLIVLTILLFFIIAFVSVCLRFTYLYCLFSFTLVNSTKARAVIIRLIPVDSAYLIHNMF